MYRIKNFKIGDEIYTYKEDQWKYCGKIVTATGECYGMSVPGLKGVMMTRKGIFEKRGYIGGKDVSSGR
tara:strand:+ start:253 stop:459 length:207 start_codon:yes stop_codon:yes gene_type:complete